MQIDCTHGLEVCSVETKTLFEFKERPSKYYFKPLRSILAIAFLLQTGTVAQLVEQRIFLKLPTIGQFRHTSGRASAEVFGSTPIA